MDDSIPISVINNYLYCPRRCYLANVEGEFADNVHTLRGTHEHERVDSLKHEMSAGVRVEYGLPVWNRSLGLTGKCDVVEFHPDGSIYPVEYKHGKRVRWLNDDLQLTAQALCLEEMLQKPVTKGAIYHQGSRRRREVDITDELREAVEVTVSAVHKLLTQNELPPPVEDSRRCPQCSLNDICQPGLARASKKLTEMRKSLFEPEEDMP